MSDPQPNIDRSDFEEHGHAPGDDAAPDPSEVEPLGVDEGVYQRDDDGNLKPLDPTVVEWNDEYHRVQFYPIPTGGLGEYQKLGAEIDMDVVCEILAEKVHEPDRTEQEWSDTDPEQSMAVFYTLVEEATGDEPQSQYHDAVQDKLEERAGEEGNSIP